MHTTAKQGEPLTIGELISAGRGERRLAVSRSAEGLVIRAGHPSKWSDAVGMLVGLGSLALGGSA